MTRSGLSWRFGELRDQRTSAELFLDGWGSSVLITVREGSHLEGIGR